MNTVFFTSNAEPSLGVELELALVNAESMELSNSIQDVLARVPHRFAERIKPEIMQSYVEINTDVCRTIAEAERDLTEKLFCLEHVTDEIGLRLYWSATHPFSLWRDQKVTPDERYEGLVELLQDMARQLVCFGDMPGNLEDSLALAALIQCLVKALSDEIDRGTYQHDCHPMMVRQNKWRASRFGLNAQLIDPFTCEPHPVGDIVYELVEKLQPVAQQLDCTTYLNRVLQLARGQSWADRQLELLQQTGDPVEVVRHFTQVSRLSPRAGEASAQ